MNVILIPITLYNRNKGCVLKSRHNCQNMFLVAEQHWKRDSIMEKE
jgi:hypothetical protein